MDVFSTLSTRTRIALALCASFLLVTALGLLFFGHNMTGDENELIKQAAGATRADMLYSHPDAPH